MTREQLEHALRETDVPDAVAARERARRTVLAAHAEAAPRRRRRGAAVWVALAAAITALVATQLSPAQAIEGIWHQVVPRPTAAPTPAPTALQLPARGRLLVTEGDALYLVERTGTRRRLGPWQDATWSPKGLFVGVSGGRSLAAIEPRTGDVRWRLTLPGSVSLPRWAPDGMHVAYRSGGALRIVYGNGVHDVLAGRRMAAVAPAWRPSDGKTIAWASTDGLVTVEDADTAKVIWSFGAGEVTRLAWSADGRRLLVAGKRRYTIHDLVAGTRRASRGDSIVGAGFAPHGSRLAVATFDGRDTTVRIDDAVALSAPGRLRDLVWSPDGRFLLAGWPGADHWLVVRARGNDAAVSAVRQRFGDGSRVRGWCC